MRAGLNKTAVAPVEGGELLWRQKATRTARTSAAREKKELRRLDFCKSSTSGFFTFASVPEKPTIAVLLEFAEGTSFLSQESLFYALDFGSVTQFCHG